jgi:tRNA (uracil-5-)-methyltransferase
MADTIPQTRQRSNSDVETPQKKIKLDVAIKAAKVAPKSGKKNKHKNKLPEPYSSEDVMWRDVVDLLGSATIEKAAEEGHDWHSPFEHGEEVQVQITNIAPTGKSCYISARDAHAHTLIR